MKKTSKIGILFAFGMMVVLGVVLVSWKGWRYSETREVVRLGPMLGEEQKVTAPTPQSVHRDSAPSSKSGTNGAGPITANVSNSAVSVDPITSSRKRILNSVYGTMSAEDLVKQLSIAQGGDLETVYLACCLRKKETLPVVLRTLQGGQLQDKRMATKLLRYIGWPEAVPVLTALLRDKDESSIARIGALYALGAIGAKGAGADIAAVLEREDVKGTERGLAMIALGRLRDQPGTVSANDWSRAPRAEQWWDRAMSHRKR